MAVSKRASSSLRTYVGALRCIDQAARHIAVQLPTQVCCAIRHKAVEVGSLPGHPSSVKTAGDVGVGYVQSLQAAGKLDAAGVAG
jgi:hypothetical protein